jgi:hypothetical protein
VCTLSTGRRASCHMWDPNSLGFDGADQDEEVKSVLQAGFLGRHTEQLFPYGIYT